MIRNHNLTHNFQHAEIQIYWTSWSCAAHWEDVEVIKISDDTTFNIKGYQNQDLGGDDSWFEELYTQPQFPPSSELRVEQNDPTSLHVWCNFITCAHHYGHHISFFKLYAWKMIEYFIFFIFLFVTELKSCGSNYCHGLLWVANAPIYGVHCNGAIVNFIDKYITYDYL